MYVCMLIEQCDLNQSSIELHAYTLSLIIEHCKLHSNKFSVTKFAFKTSNIGASRLINKELP